MAYFSYPPTTTSGAGIPTYANFGAFPSAAVAGNGGLAIALDSDTLYISDGTSWHAIASPSTVLTVGTFDSGTPNANGAHIDTNALIMQSASAANPGLVNTAAQTLAGVKTFSSAPILSSLTASQALVLDASKNVATLAYSTSATANALVERDSSGNSRSNNFLPNLTSTASAGGTTALTIGSSRIQLVTGSSAQTFTLPDATTLTVGFSFEFNNNSTQSITINNFGGSLVRTLATAGYTQVICTSTGSSNGTWDTHSLLTSTSSSGALGLAITGIFTATSTVQGTQLISTVATGTAPLVVTSTTQVANLNASSAGSFTGSLVGDVTGTQGATVLSATTNGTLTSLTALTTAASLSTVGTVSTGTWSATTIAINKGGTGQTTAAAAFAALSPMTTAGDIIYEAAGPTPARLAIGSTGNVLTVTGGVPVWAPPATSGTVTSVAMSVPAFLSVTGSPVTSTGTLAVSLSGTALPVANGGTGLTSGTSGGVLGYTASGTLASSAALTASQLVVGGGAGATPSTLAAGTSGQYLRMNSTPIPAWFTIASPTIQKFTSGSGTYTLPANVTWVQVRMVGGGGGGGGGCNTGGSFSSSGGAGGNTTFGSSFLVANGGGGGVWNGQPSAGGTASIAAGATGTALQGGSSTSGQPIIGATNNALGGTGAYSPMGGAGGCGYGNAVGVAAIANSGSGGGGGGTGTTGGGNNVAGGGGAAGGFVLAVIQAPSATYAYAVGAAGTAGTVGTVGSFAGGAGGSGYIEVTEHYS